MSGTEGTPRRASFVSPGPRSLGSTGGSTPVLADCPGNDDERERRQRRRSKITDIQLGATDSPLGLGSPLPRQAEARLQETLQWTNAQIAEHYNTCIKLSTENKITTKNAFGLHLIDYLTEILQQKESGETDFKVAVGTLDASAKIYSARVDVIHADTYRVLGGLGKDVAATDDKESPEGEASTAPEAAKRAQKKSKRSFKTIAQDVSSIDLPEASRRCEVNPMFQRTAAAFDQGSTAGVFLSRTHTSGCHTELLSDSKLPPLPAAPSTEPVAVPGLKALLEDCLGNHPICSSLAGFQFTKWDADTHDESVSALLEKLKRSEQAFDVAAALESDPEEPASPLPHSPFSSDSPGGAARTQLGEFQEDLSPIGTTNQGS
ncbi:condensin complex subunit 2, partial [Melanerpes formicivorus]|uniref:condensin complex subunit 2 n=1 Tax=Melanerpes formicivorus TaxID=211600 RepID=UPI00358F39A3